MSSLRRHYDVTKPLYESLNPFMTSLNPSMTSLTPFMTSLTPYDLYDVTEPPMTFMTSLNPLFYVTTSSMTLNLSMTSLTPSITSLNHLYDFTKPLYFDVTTTSMTPLIPL